MLMSLPDLAARYDMKVTGVLHLGAHLAEEAATYNELHMHDVWWVEANPGVLAMIERNIWQYPTQKLIHGLIYDIPFVEHSFNITNYDGMSSSILEFGTHPEFSPDTVFVDTIKMKTTTVDTIVADHKIKANFLNMDLQGAELLALRGARHFLPGVDYVMTEVNKKEVYKDCARISDIDTELARHGLARVETYWVPGQGWGDALYVRESKL